MKEPQFVLLSMLLVLLGCAPEREGAVSEPEERPLRILMTGVPCATQGADRIEFFYVLRNAADTPYTEAMPYQWYGLVWDWFEVELDGENLRNLLAERDYGFDKKTVLGPGEQVTIAVDLGVVAQVPEAPQERTGTYTVTALELRDKTEPWLPIERPEPLSFEVVAQPRPVTCESPLPDLTEDERVQQAVGLLGAAATEPGTRLAILRQGFAASPEVASRLLAVTSDTYAIVAALREVDPQPAHRDALLGLLDSTDLAVRRAALGALGRMGVDEGAAARVEAFLAGQTDEPTREIAERALRTLRQ